MINNRQAGRRRGRGGGQRPGNPGRPEQGSRIDNRARGNAQQLHEKYKNLARDAQMAGDRINTEYYLQFADHYFRVLNEARARYEEQRRQHGGGDEDYDGEEGGDEFDAPRERMHNGETRRDREPRQDREQRQDREPRHERQQPAEAAGQQNEVQAEADERNDFRNRRRRVPREANGEAAPERTIDADRLPPALSVAPEAANSEEAPAEAAPRRRGRPRRVDQANDTVEVPPAA